MKKEQQEPISYGKESEPLTTHTSTELHTYKEGTEQTENQTEKLPNYVEQHQEIPEIPPDLKKVGLQPAQPTSFSSYQNIKLPLPDDKIAVGLRAPITSSLRWLATFAVYLLKVAHLQLKMVHGKAIRVIQRG